MKTLYIIAGPNGAGKTTASYRILPELWDCREFVNADEIAKGLSPLNPAEMALEAGKLQLMRIQQLLSEGESFSIETTLATRSYVRLVRQAHSLGYEVELLFFYLPSAQDAIDRVRLRVLSGGHDIPEDVIRRRYALGLRNLFCLYMPIVDRWKLVDNTENPSTTIAFFNREISISQPELFHSMHNTYGRPI